ncbi:hypothetical protein L249_5369, partial [Ophiocordyceps polyrhachis-furcata BCC 54312]
VGKKGPNKVICIPSQRAEPGLITSKGYTSRITWENPPSFIDNFSGIKTCTCRSDRSDRSDPMTPAMTAMTRPLRPL